MVNAESHFVPLFRVFSCAIGKQARISEIFPSMRITILCAILLCTFGARAAEQGPPAAAVVVHYAEFDEPDIQLIQFTTNGNRLMIVGEFDVRVWDVHTKKPFGKVLHIDKPIRLAAISADGVHVATVSNRIASIWSLTSGTCAHKLSSEADLTHISFSPDGSRVLASCVDAGTGTAGIWSTTGKKILDIANNELKVLVLSPDRRFLASIYKKTPHIVALQKISLRNDRNE